MQQEKMVKEFLPPSTAHIAKIEALPQRISFYIIFAYDYVRG